MSIAPVQKTQTALTRPTTPFDPESIEQAITLAERLSKSGLLPTSLRGKPDDVLVVLLTGRELGLSAMQSLRNLHVINGRPVMSADLMVGLCLARPDICESFQMVESTAQKCTYSAKRRGQEPSRLTWTIEDARGAKLTGKDNWAAYPAAMLRARCKADLARAVFPDLVSGIYAEEEEISATGEGERFSPPPAQAAARTAPVVDVNPEAPASFAEAAEAVVPDEEIAAIEEAIAVSESKSQLETLVPRIKALTDDRVRNHLRGLYADRVKALKAGAGQ